MRYRLSGLRVALIGFTKAVFNVFAGLIDSIMVAPAGRAGARRSQGGLVHLCNLCHLWIFSCPLRLCA